MHLDFLPGRVAIDNSVCELSERLLEGAWSRAAETCMVPHIREEAAPLRAWNFSLCSGNGVFQQNRSTAEVRVRALFPRLVPANSNHLTARSDRARLRDLEQRADRKAHRPGHQAQRTRYQVRRSSCEDLIRRAKQAAANAKQDQRIHRCDRSVLGHWRSDPTPRCSLRGAIPMSRRCGLCYAGSSPSSGRY